MDSSISGSAIIHADSRLERSSVGDESVVYRGAWLRDSVLRNHCFASDFSKLDHCSLDDYSRAGRFNHFYHASLGRHTYTGQNTVVMHCDIASFTSISWNVTIGAGEHNYHYLSSHTFLYNPYDELYDGEPAYDRFSEPVTIGNDVWIGAGACVLRGASIGNGAVIGANTVVTQNVPPYAIVVGNPGRIIRYRFSTDVIEKLQELEWWNLRDATLQKAYSILKNKLPDSGNIDEIVEQIMRE